MFSQSKITVLFALVAVATVQGFAPLAQPKTASTTELGAFFFQKPSEEAGAVVAEETKKFANPFAKFAKEAPVAEKKAAPKKAAPKKAAPKKAAIKAVKPPARKNVPKASGKTFAKNDFVVRKPEKGNKKLTIYERQCHIN